MQSFTPSTPVEGENTGGKSKASSCHASTAPAKTKLSESSHGDKTPNLVVKKPTYLLLKENGDVKPNQIIKVIVKPQTPACIKAGDVGSLLDQFLEYEQKQSTCKCITLVKGSSISLTPISSPSHINKPNFTGIGCNANSANSPPNGLTPPVSPPLQSPAENTSTSCYKTALVVKPTETFQSPENTPTKPEKVSENIPPNAKAEVLKTTCNKATGAKNNKIEDANGKIKNSKETEAKSNQIEDTSRNLKIKEISEAKSVAMRDTSNDIVRTVKETKVDVDVKKPTNTEEMLHKSVVSTLPSEIQRHASARQNLPPRKSDKVYQSNERKRGISLDDDDDDDEDDRSDYYDFKRKKYSKDECYWTTSEEESDDSKGRYKGNRRKELRHRSTRKHSHNYSCSDSDHDNDRHKRGRSHRKSQRRHERSPRRSRSHGRDNISDSDDDSHRRRRHHHHHHHHNKHKRHDRKLPEKEDSKEENVHLYDIENERKKNFKLDRSIKETSKEKRKIVYIGNIEKSVSKSDIWTIFRKFGPIEKTTVHYRDDGDNYAFVTFVDPSSALDAIDEGKRDPKLKDLDICFGGRRKFCGGSYVDFDSTTSCLEEQQEKEGSRKSSHSNEEMDFDTLLQMALKKTRR